jgi:predicted lactoylglutathione lyase
MSNSREIDYQELRRLTKQQAVRFIPPALHLAENRYFVMARDISKTETPREVCATLSQEQFEELKDMGRRVKNYTKLNKPEEA